VVGEVVAKTVKPKLRGVSHTYAFFGSLVAGAALILAASGGEAKAAAAVYAFAVSGLFGTSALYHRVTWRPTPRRWMRRLDHSMIFILIAGTYTPIALLALHGPLATTILVVVWVGAIAGIVFKLFWIDAPKWLFAIIYVALGLVAGAVGGELPAAIGWLGAAGIALGGIFYVTGAVIYAAEKPNPSPTVFGYHEVFHVLVIAAAVVHYAVIAFLVVPKA